MVKNFTKQVMRNNLRAKLVRAGIAQIDIADDTGYSETFVSLVISGERISDKIEKCIAKKLRIHPDDLWKSENYFKGGN